MGGEEVGLKRRPLTVLPAPPDGRAAHLRGSCGRPDQYRRRVALRATELHALRFCSGAEGCGVCVVAPGHGAPMPCLANRVFHRWLSWIGMGAAIFVAALRPSSPYRPRISTLPF